jgi:hypothetical protein
MSTEAEHLALANRNQAALDHLLSDTARCSEWVAVVAFYKSLHVAEAVFLRGKSLRRTAIITTFG